LVIYFVSLSYTATMSATQRSSYAREDTDITPEENAGRTSQSNRRGSKIDQLFPKEFHATTPEKPAISEKGIEDGSGRESGTDLPQYEGEMYGRHQSMVATTAEDLVTRVINVEDDPTLNPWTFRTFFLGTSH
jgi:hypothetical protein